MRYELIELLFDLLGALFKGQNSFVSYRKINNDHYQG